MRRGIVEIITMGYNDIVQNKSIF